MTSRKIFFLTIIIFACNFGILAQQVPFFTQYMMNPYVYNPAFAGTIYHYQLNASYRYQWVGVEDSPVSFYVSGHGHVGKDHPFQRRRHMNQNDWHNGVGFIVSTDQTGPIIRRNTVMISYAYDMPLGKITRLSFGISAGMRQFQVDGNKAIARDASVEISSPSVLLPDASAGLWLYHDLFFVGISATQLFMNKIDARIFPVETGTNRLFQHYFVTAGAVINLLPDPRIDAIPSVAVKQVEFYKKPSVDFNMKLKYRQLAWKERHAIWMGTSYRNEQGLSFMVGGKFNDQFDVGFAYDLTLSYMSNVSRGSHEIFLGYQIHPKVRVMSPSDYW